MKCMCGGADTERKTEWEKEDHLEDEREKGQERTGERKRDQMPARLISRDHSNIMYRC